MKEFKKCVWHNSIISYCVNMLVLLDTCKAEGVGDCSGPIISRLNTIFFDVIPGE